MQKDFDAWNKRKKEINEEEPNFYYEREIRWCSLGVNKRNQKSHQGFTLMTFLISLFSLMFP